MRSESRRWTVATWLVAGMGDLVDAIAAAIVEADVDAVVLQSVREHDLETIAGAAGYRYAWELSHHPRSRLLPGSALGLAVVTPHRVAGSTAIPITEQTSLWSSKRRIAQVALVERDDHTGYALAHAVGSISTRMFDTPSNAPTVRIHPAQVGIDDRRVIELPDRATLVGTAATTPIDGERPLVSATFEMPWVRGELPAT